MAVKIGKLFNDTKFTSLSMHSKLLYTYLSQSPNINTVGVLSLDIQVVCIQIGITVDKLREAMLELVKKDYILCENIDGVVYFVVLDHFHTLPSSDAIIRKSTQELLPLPKKLVQKLHKFNIKPAAKLKEFKEPTIDEVNNYALSQGYNINGKDVVEFYQREAAKRGKKGVWVDSRGKIVRDWRRKIKQVWCKDERKMQPVKDAPKGFEYFHIVVDDKMVFPDYFKNGKPFSKNIAINKQLNRAYEERKGNS